MSLFFFQRKYIEIDIVDDEDYQKNEVFYVELGEPIPENIGKKLSHYPSNRDQGLKFRLVLTEEGNEAGKPRIGDQSRIEIHIKESKVIKVSLRTDGRTSLLE